MKIRPQRIYDRDYGDRISFRTLSYEMSSWPEVKTLRLQQRDYLYWLVSEFLPAPRRPLYATGVDWTTDYQQPEKYRRLRGCFRQSPATLAQAQHLFRAWNAISARAAPLGRVPSGLNVR